MLASTATPAKAKAARNLYDAGGTTVADIARVVGVSRATLYRNLKVGTSVSDSGAGREGTLR